MMAYKKGDEIILSERPYHIREVAGNGRRSIVYQVNNREGIRYALKVPINRDPVTINSFKNEVLKSRSCVKYGFQHAKVIELGADYILKEWVDGIRGDAWTREWAHQGFPAGALQIISLGKLILDSARRKIYIRDLNQNNLIWNGGNWIIIDSGSIKKKFSRRGILRLYRDYVSENWGRSTTPECSEIFRRLLP